LLASAAQLIVLVYGIYLISVNDFTIGSLVIYFSYANSFYNPLRQLATLWTSFQTAMAGWDRVSQILSLETNLVTVQEQVAEPSTSLLEFRNVHFAYPGG